MKFDHLIELCRNLNKGEKRIFSMLTSRYEGEKAYLSLYRIILSGDADQGEIKQTFTRPHPGDNAMVPAYQ